MIIVEACPSAFDVSSLRHAILQYTSLLRKHAAQGAVRLRTLTARAAA